jgi:hypothetical protein
MHLAGTIAIDFLTVPTVTFNILYVFFVLSLDRRCLLHLNVTAHPYAEWAAQQIVEAVGFDTSIARLIRDRDRIYGAKFDARVNYLGIEQVRIAPRAPWQMDVRSGLWAHSAASCSTTSSCSESATCCDWSKSTCATTTRTVRTWPYRATHPSRALYRCQAADESSRLLALVGSIIGTRGLHE